MTDEKLKVSIDMPEDVHAIMKAFMDLGYEIYAVGGCVRDSILKRKVNDWDMCTDASPDNIIRACELNDFKYVPTGLKHGTVTIVLNRENYELTTYRIDGEYSDGRHPDEVIFTSKIEEDLSRRDFTINAMAYNPVMGLKDCFCGMDDIKAGLIRCVGDPFKRFNEDSLRRFRAVRFAAQLGFTIEPFTYEELTKSVETIEALSAERIRDEMVKIIMSNRASYGIRELQKLGMLKIVLPELDGCAGFDQKNRHHDKDVFEHTMTVLDGVSEKLDLRLAALLHDIGKPLCMTIDENGSGHFKGHAAIGGRLAENILKRLRFDNSTIKRVVMLIDNHMGWYDRNGSIIELKEFMARVGRDNLEDMFELQKADIMGSAEKYRNFEEVTAIEGICRDILMEGQPLYVKDLAVNGKDILKLGIKPGKELGDILDRLLKKVLERPELNTREKLIEIVRHITDN